MFEIWWNVFVTNAWISAQKKPCFIIKHYFHTLSYNTVPEFCNPVGNYRVYSWPTWNPLVVSLWPTCDPFAINRWLLMALMLLTCKSIHMKHCWKLREVSQKLSYIFFDSIQWNSLKIWKKFSQILCEIFFKTEWYSLKHYVKFFSKLHGIVFKIVRNSFKHWGKFS